MWLMQKIEDRCYHSGWFICAPHEDANPYHLIQSGKADAALIAPEGGLTRALEKGNARVQLLVDAEKYYQGPERGGLSAGHRGEAVEEQTHLKTARAAHSVRVRYLYNPELQTSVYMVPGVLCMVLVIITVVLTSSSISRERNWVPLRRSSPPRPSPSRY